MVKKKEQDYQVGIETRDEKTYLRDWARNVIKGLNSVDDKTARKILKKCGEMCARSWMRIAGLDKQKFSLSTLILTMNKYPGCYWKRNGNTVYEEVQSEKCICPLVTWRIIEPNPKMCVACDPNWYETLFKDTTGLSIRTELLDSVAQGSNKCILRHHILPTRIKVKTKLRKTSTR